MLGGKCDAPKDEVELCRGRSTTRDQRGEVGRYVPLSDPEQVLSHHPKVETEARIAICLI
jgi:hypothetical protein